MAGPKLWAVLTADTVERGELLPFYIAWPGAALTRSARRIAIALGGTVTDADLARPFDVQMTELAAANGCFWESGAGRLSIPPSAPNPIVGMLETALPAMAKGADLLTLAISSATGGAIGRASSTAAVIDRWQAITVDDLFASWTRTVAVAAAAGDMSLSFTPAGRNVPAGTRLGGAGIAAGTDAFPAEIHTVVLSQPLTAPVAPGTVVTCTPVGFDFDAADASRIARDGSGGVSAWTCGRTGVSVSQPSASRRPTWVDAQANGHPAVRFAQTGAPKSLQTGTAQADDLVRFMAPDRQAYTMYAVVRQDARLPGIASGHSLLHWGDGTHDRMLRSETSVTGVVGNPAMAMLTSHAPRAGQPAPGSFTAFRTCGHDVSDAAGRWALVEVTCDGGAVEILVDGRRSQAVVTLTVRAAIGANALAVHDASRVRRGMRLARTAPGIPFSCDVTAISGDTVTLDAAIAGHDLAAGTTLVFEDPIPDWSARTNALATDRFAIGRHGSPTIGQLWSGDVARLVGVRGLVDFRARIGLRRHLAMRYGIPLAPEAGTLDLEGYEPAFCEVWPDGFKEWDGKPWREGGRGWRSRYAVDYSAEVGASRLANGDTSVSPDLTVDTWRREQNPFRIGRRGSGGLVITAEPLSGSLLAACQQDPTGAMSPPAYQFRAGVATTVDAYWQEYGIWSCLCETDAVSGPGFVPAFWLLSQSRVWPPEIDVFELFGGMPGVAAPALHHRRSRRQYAGASSRTSSGMRLMTSQSRNRRVLYECKVTRDWIEFYVDRCFVGRLPTPFELRTHLYAVCSLGTGSTTKPSWLGRPLPGQRYPVAFTFHAVSAWRPRYSPPPADAVPASDVDADALLAAMRVAPPAPREAAIRRLVHRLKLWSMDRGGSLWDGIGFLFVHAAHDRQAGRINWKNPAVVAAEIAPVAPVFTIDRGFRGNGSSGVLGSAAGASGLDSGIVLSKGGMPFTPTEFAAFGLLASAPSGQDGTIIEMGATLHLSPGPGPSLTMRPNHASSATRAVPGSGPGFYAFNRNTYIVTPQRNDLVPSGIWALEGDQSRNAWASGQSVKLATGTADVAASGMCVDAREMDLRYLSDCLREYGAAVGIAGV